MSGGDLCDDGLVHLVDGVGVLPQLRVESLAAVSLLWSLVVAGVDLQEQTLQLQKTGEATLFV